MVDGTRTPPSPDLRRYDDPAAFAAAALPFLLEHEAEHCLPIGICRGLIDGRVFVDQAPYLAVVELGGRVVAVAMRTPPHQAILSRVDAPAAMPLLAPDLLDADPALPGIMGPAAVSLAVAEEWSRLTGRAHRWSRAQRIFQLETVIPVTGVPGKLRRATEVDRDLAVAWVRAFAVEAGDDVMASQVERSVDARLASTAGGISLWEDGGPVSLVGCGGPTPHSMRIGPVYTPPEHRRQGYASAATAALSQMLLDGGRRFVFLFTDLANPTSNRIYQAIGYRPVADVGVYRFDTP